ncbi:MAG: class II aldolase/adducin family protein [Bdellovibrionia bacterium]
MANAGTVTNAKSKAPIRFFINPPFNFQVTIGLGPIHKQVKTWTDGTKTRYFVAHMSDLKKRIVDACHEMDRRQFVANHDGNISVRLEADRFLVTPTSFAKRDVAENDILLVDTEGKVLEGPHRVFSEWKIHRAIYECDSAVTSVCHAHPPYAMGLGLAGKQIEFPSIPEAIVSLGGPITTTGFLAPTAAHTEIKGEIMPAIQNCYAFLIPGNGVFAVGDDPTGAYLRVELVEQVAKALAVAFSVGQPKSLPRDLIRDLLSKRPVLKPSWKKTAVEEPPAAPVAKEVPAMAVFEAKSDQVRDIIRSEIQKLLKF